MNLAIIGGKGEMAEELFYLVISSGEQKKYNNIFCVDLQEDRGNNIVSEEMFFQSDRSSSRILIAMGEPSMRHKMLEKYSENGFEMATYIHPTAVISHNTYIEAGSIILPQVYIAQNVTIGRNVLVHSGARIENNSMIGDNCFVSCNAFIGAKTRIGTETFIGPGAILRDSLSVGDNSIIGMGSVVTKDVEPDSVCYGNPARKTRKNSLNKVF